MMKNEYEMEMQEQAEYMSRWKLRKEIKKKLKALRKMLKGDIVSLPQLNIIDKDLATLADPRTLEALRILEENGKDVPAPQTPTIKYVPYHVEHYKKTFVYDPHIEDIILKQMSEEFGYELLKANAIQYRIYNSAIINKKQVEMKVDVVIEDKMNPAKNINSPVLPTKESVE